MAFAAIFIKRSLFNTPGSAPIAKENLKGATMLPSISKRKVAGYLV